MTEKFNDTDKRPVNLDLRTIRFPLNAIASILHRISGLFLFLSIPLILLLFKFSLSQSENFDLLKEWFTCLWIKLLAWLILTGLLYHMVAGVRHLLMDLHIGDSKRGARIAVICVFAVSFFGSLSFLLYLFKV